MTLAVVGLALVAGGAVAALGFAGSLPGDTAPLAAAAVLAVLAGGVVLVGLAGRRDGALGGLALLAGLVAVAVAVAPTGANARPFGQAVWRPADAVAARDGFALGAGDQTVDLSRLVPRGADLVVPVRTGFGQTVVEVPEGTPVRVRARLLIGAVGSLDELPAGWTTEGRISGFTPDADITSPDRGSPGLVVDVRGVVGEVFVVVVPA